MLVTRFVDGKNWNNKKEEKNLKKHNDLRLNFIKKFLTEKKYKAENTFKELIKNFHLRSAFG